MKKTLKTILMMVLVLALTVNAFAFAETEEDKWIELDSVIASDISTSAEEWFGTSNNRALLTVCMMVEISDYLSQAGEEEFDWLDALFETSYVGKSGLTLCVSANDGTGKQVIIAFTPITGDISFGIIPFYSDDITLDALQETCEDGVYENDLDEILEILLGLLEE